MKTNSSKSHSRSLMITLVMGIGVMVYLLFVFLPAQRSIGQLRQQVTEKRQYVLDVEAEYAKARDVQAEIDQIDAFLLSTGMRGGQEVEMAGLLTAITNSAQRSQVAVQRISPLQPEQQARLSKQNLEVLVEGEFRQIFEFLRSLEAWPGNAWLSSVQFDGERENGQTLTCRLNLTVFTNSHDSSD